MVGEPRLQVVEVRVSEQVRVRVRERVKAGLEARSGARIGLQ